MIARKRRAVNRPSPISATSRDASRLVTIQTMVLNLTRIQTHIDSMFIFE